MHVKMNSFALSATRKVIATLIAISLQEPHLRASESSSLKGSIAFNKHAPDGDRAAGGSSILVRSDMVCMLVVLDITLQAVAVHLMLHKTNSPFHLHSSKLPSHVTIIGCSYEPVTIPIFMGDFNGHSPLWEGNTGDSKGKRIEDFVDGHAVLNNGSYT